MKVVIFDTGFIPGLGKGPFESPIEISQDQFFLYKQMGLTIIRADKSVPIVESGIKNRDIDGIESNTRKNNRKLSSNFNNSKNLNELLGDKETLFNLLFNKNKNEEDTEPSNDLIKEDSLKKVETPMKKIEPVIDEPLEKDVTEPEEDTEKEEEVTTEPEEDTEKEEEVEEVDLNSLTKKELIELLTEAGVECNSNMTKAKLVELANENL